MLGSGLEGFVCVKNITGIIVLVYIVSNNSLKDNHIYW